MAQMSTSAVSMEQRRRQIELHLSLRYVSISSAPNATRPGRPASRPPADLPMRNRHAHSCAPPSVMDGAERMMSGTSKTGRDEAPHRPGRDEGDESRRREGEAHPAGPHADERLT